MKLVVFANTDWYLYNYRVPIDTLLRAKGVETVMVSPPGEFSDKIIEAGFKWYPVNMSRKGMNIFEELKTHRDLKAILEKEKPDAIHSFTIKGNVHGSLAAYKAKVPRIVNSITGLGYIHSSKSLKAWALRQVVNVLHRITLSKGKTIFQNHEDHHNFIKAGVVKKEEAYLIRSSGVDLTRFKPEPFPEGDKINVLFASRLLWIKGVQELVDAAKILKAKNSNINIQMVGLSDDGNPASVPQHLVEQWHKDGVIEYLGFSSDMPSLINNAHIVCFPSKQKEGTPKFLVEAAGCGRPIITTNNRGCTEVVVDGLNGFLVEVGEVAGLVEKLELLANDRALMAKMGDECLKIAKEQFDVVDVAYRSFDVYTAK